MRDAATRGLSVLLLMGIFFVLARCGQESQFRTLEKSNIEQEVSRMLHDYHEAMRDGGLLAEFDYLEDSEDFYWVPPGYEIALSYDSVKTILEENARSVIAVDYQWDTLRVYPLAPSVANFHGRLSGEMTTVVNGATVVQEVWMIESGTVVRRGGQWRLLSGQTTDLLKAAADDNLALPMDSLGLVPNDSLSFEGSGGREAPRI